MTPQVLDPCCGSRMFWFNKNNQHALFGDCREEERILCDGRVLKISPDMKLDFRALPLVPVSQILSLCDVPPLFGNKQPKQTGTHWIVFMKGRA